MFFPYGETVIVLSPSPKVDPFSGEETGVSWDDPTETEIQGCAVAPRTSEEPLQAGRTPVIVGLTVFMPYNTVITSRDRLLIDDVVYEIEGEPAYWKNPFTGYEAGVEVQIKRVDG
jgi:hypothetical protein